MNEDLDLEIFHPGGLDITQELAELCHIGKNMDILDVASGTGESACFLAKNFGCRVIGVEASDYLVKAARKKARERKLKIEFKKGDAHHLPFKNNTFDVVICECAVCLMGKKRAISEMVRVVKKKGYVGIHDICWKEDTPEDLKQRLAVTEDEGPETLEGWKKLFEKTGLKNFATVDKACLVPAWADKFRKEAGVTGQLKQLKIVLKTLENWRAGGHKEPGQILQSPYTGYGIIVGRKL